MSDTMPKTLVNTTFSLVSSRLTLALCAMGAMGLLFAACNGGNDEKYNDGPTYGNIRIAVDETYAPIIDSQLIVFHASYPNAHITVKYESEAEAINDLLADSVRLAIVSHPLTEAQLAPFRKQGYTPKTLGVAIDAVAVVTNPANPVEEMTYETLAAYTSGASTAWQKPFAGSGKVQLVFDNSNSSTVHYIVDTLNGGKPLAPHTAATKKNTEVLEFVAHNPNALGFIGVNWISDPEDTTRLSFLKKVNVLALHPAQGKTGYGEAFQPLQYHIARKLYPLTRPVYAINREARAGLGTGFQSFLAGQRGQLIFYQGGLVPGQVNLRVKRDITITHKPVNK